MIRDSKWYGSNEIGNTLKANRLKGKIKNLSPHYPGGRLTLEYLGPVLRCNCRGACEGYSV